MTIIPSKLAKHPGPKADEMISCSGHPTICLAQSGPRNYFRKRAASPEARFTGGNFLFNPPSAAVCRLAIR